MKYLKYILPAVLIIAAFFAGQFTAGDNTELLEKKFEQERQRDRDSISGLLHENTLLKARMDSRGKEHKKDSTARAEALARQKGITAALIKQNEQINYESYSNPDLDSIDAILFGAR